MEVDVVRAGSSCLLDGLGICTEMGWRKVVQRWHFLVSCTIKRSLRWGSLGRVRTVDTRASVVRWSEMRIKGGERRM
jgi:hypothetical protein